MRVEVRTGDVSGIAVLGVWVRTVPMLLLAGVVTVAATILTVPIGISVVVSGRVPARLAAFQVWAVRQRVRTFSGLFLLRPDAPPWPRAVASQDPGDDPYTTVALSPPQELPRTAPIAHAVRATAHLVVLVPIAVVLDLLLPVWGIVVARRGWSSTARVRLVAVERWTAAVLAHAWLVNGEAPCPNWQELRWGRPGAAVQRAEDAVLPAVGIEPPGRVVAS